MAPLRILKATEGDYQLHVLSTLGGWTTWGGVTTLLRRRSFLRQRGAGMLEGAGTLEGAENDGREGAEAIAEGAEAALRPEAGEPKTLCPAEGWDGDKR